ncbi:unnamed protein product [Arctogadus glacialis]
MLTRASVGVTPEGSKGFVRVPTEGSEVVVRGRLSVEALSSARGPQRAWTWPKMDACGRAAMRHDRDHLDRSSVCQPRSVGAQGDWTGTTLAGHSSNVILRRGEAERSRERRRMRGRERRRERRRRRGERGEGEGEREEKREEKEKGREEEGGEEEKEDREEKEPGRAEEDMRR